MVPAGEKNVKHFPIVGLGASAGGLDALEKFFEKIPADCGMAFIVIQHLAPDRKDILCELLQKVTRLKVFQASNLIKVKQNCIYLIPPNKNLSVQNGILHLSAPTEARGLRFPIDFFFHSLAEDQKERGIAVILSGMGSDGSLGLKAIKEKDGIVLVQEPSSAKFDSMPRSAIDSVIVDIVGTPEELPQKLFDYIKINSPLRKKPEVKVREKVFLDKIIAILKERSGHDFALYRKNTLSRRIERRKGIHQIEQLKDYVKFIQENKQESDILFKELLIGVTSFFRDYTVWETLEEKILPEIIKKLPKGYIFRAWVAGCSTGEEAYSLAIIFMEILEKLKRSKDFTIQIFATDLDNNAIEKARKGIFSSNIAADVSPKRLKRFFNEEDGNYRVKTFVREMIVFATQNITKDPPFTSLDVLTCRNMLIYMEAKLQKQLFSVFNYSLKNGGVLVLGTAENPGNENENYSVIDGKLKIFANKNSSGSVRAMDLSPAFLQSYVNNKKSQSLKSKDSFQIHTDQFLLQQFLPVSVLLNDMGDVIYMTGKISKYLEPVAGKANWNIYAMARDGLRTEIPKAMRKAKTSYDPVNLKGIKIKFNGKIHTSDITFQRIKDHDILNGMILVFFSEISITEESHKIQKLSPSSNKIVDFKNELERNHDEMNYFREEMQRAQEVLKSTNEELQSTNEELQSTNEELTTSKEELQSLNEELQTINAELQSKINDYVAANNDLNNLLNSTENATLFLDKNLNIRRFTSQMTKIFKIRDMDIGRPFNELVTNLHYSDIENDAIQVIKTLKIIEITVPANNLKWYSIRMMPYHTLENKVDGLVITFTDVSNSKKLENELKNVRNAKS